MAHKDFYIRFGELVKKHRNLLDMTQDEFGKQVSLSRASIANIENGRQKILIHQLIIFAKQLNVKPEDLLPGDDLQDFPTLNAKTREEEKWIQAILREAQRNA